MHKKNLICFVLAQIDPRALWHWALAELGADEPPSAQHSHSQPAIRSSLSAGARASCLSVACRGS